MYRILIVDDRPEIGRQTLSLLDRNRYEVEVLETADQAQRRLARDPEVSVVLWNVGPENTGTAQSIRQLREVQPLAKVIALLSSDCGEAVSDARRFADGCIWTPWDAAVLDQAVRECLAPAPQHVESPGDVEELEAGTFFVAASPSMRRLRAQLNQIARINVPVLCLGESGTGKEVIARIIHRLSPRFNRPFLKVNCAAVPGELLESELFGHERGAFTGAVRAKLGKFEACNYGTLFLDEIAEMSPALQAKLLHVLQDGEFTRLGGCSPIRANVRIVAATNVKIAEAIAAKTFREDLYYRLTTFVFTLPALRERPQDVPILLQRYLALYAQRFQLPNRPIPPLLWEACLRYSWPGNVRELENFVKRYLICGDDALDFAGAQRSLGVDAVERVSDLKSHVRDLRNDAEAAAIKQTLEQTHWNRKEAAEVLNISYKSLLTKIRVYGLDKQTGMSSSRAVFPQTTNGTKPLVRTLTGME